MTKQIPLFDPTAIRRDSLPALREREYLACRAYLRELLRYCRRPGDAQEKALTRQKRVWRDHCCNLPAPEHKDRTQIGLRRAEAIKRRMSLPEETRPGNQILGRPTKSLSLSAGS